MSPVDLYRSLDEQRIAKNLSWRQLAAIVDVNSSVFTRMQSGAAPRWDAGWRMLGWLGENPPRRSTSEERIAQRVAELLRLK